MNLFFLRRFLFYVAIVTCSPIGLFSLIAFCMIQNLLILSIPVVIGLIMALNDVRLFKMNKFQWLRQEAYTRLSCKCTSKLYCPDDQ